MPKYKGVYAKRYKKNDGTVVTKYYGAKHHHDKTFTTKLYNRAVDAAQAYNDLVQELERGSYADKRLIKVSAFIDLWLEEFLFPQTKSEDGIVNTTYVTTTSKLNTVKKYIGNRILQKLTTKELDKLQNDLRLKYSSTYAQMLMKQLGRVMGTALKWNFIKVNTIENIHKQKVKQKKVIPYTEDELFLMLKNADERSAAIIALAGIQGMRISEIFGLMKKDILFKDRMIIIERQYYQGELLERTKSESSKRIIPMFPETEHFIKRWLLKAGPSKWLFPSSRDNSNPQQSRSWINTYYRPLLKSLGIQVRKFHTLRHTCDKLLQDKGFSTRAVMQILGHKDTRMTLVTYDSKSPEYLKEITENKRFFSERLVRNTVRKLEKE